MRPSVGILCGALTCLGSPALAVANQGTATVLVPTDRGTWVTTTTAHLAFALPTGTWRRAEADDGTPRSGVYQRRSVIGGHTCTVRLYVDGRMQNRRPTRLLGVAPKRDVRRGTTGAYHWLTSRSTGPGAPAAAAYRSAPHTTKRHFVSIVAAIDLVEPATAACRRSGARVVLRPLVTSFRVVARNLDSTRRGLEGASPRHVLEDRR